MDNSAVEALMIGVNTMVFIVALSAGMILMRNINDMVEYANMATESVTTGSLIENVGNTQERTFTGAEVYALYGQYKAKEIEDGIKIKVATTGASYDIEEFGKGQGLSYLNKTFVLKNTSPNEFLFELKKD